VGPLECLRALFPGGSITGAPKIRAMEIIDDLEPTARSVYTGAIGYFAFDRSLDLNIAIRTVIVKDGLAYFQAGGGIVADSDPEAEYEETLHKARALADALSGRDRPAEHVLGVPER
jgi:para-aminobenzoate synthetase component 1